MNLGNKYFTIGNINTEDYEQLRLNFGLYSSSDTPLTVEYRTDSDGQWTELSYDLQQQNAGNWSWIEK